MGLNFSSIFAKEHAFLKNVILGDVMTPKEKLSLVTCFM
jgi:hypothetical protein